MKNTCPTCGEPLPATALRSVSHTILPGAQLCSDCGQRETADPLWADGRRVGFGRARAAQKILDGGENED